MENQITYLIGAGASANTMPVIKDFADKLEIFANNINSTFLSLSDSFNAGIRINEFPKDVRKRFSDDIKWLADECRLHSSIDTFAKKLFLSDRLNELLKLKAIVSEFLLFTQIRNGIDKRYDAFFAAIIKKTNNGLQLPKNIKIISWNYDKQIECSINQFNKTANSNQIEDFIQVIPRRNNIEIDPKSFCLIKLNGSVGGKITNEGYLPMNIDYNLIGNKLPPEIEKNILIEMLYRYYTIEQRILHSNKQPGFFLDEYPTITYSWEEDIVHDSGRNYAYDIMKNTNILVVIGYSFPVFNRNIDKKLLQGLNKLQKVYIQSKEETIEGVTQRFKSLFIFPVIEQIKNVEEFIIPFEY